MSQITVADVSRWQGTINWDEFRKHVQAVVIKATGYDGGGYADGMLARNRDEARRVGLPRWFYHYKGAGDAAEQARYCLSQIGTLLPGEAIVIDDEDEAKLNVAFCAAFADEIKRIAGHNTPVYSNLSRFQGVNLAALKERNLGAWVAKHGGNTGTVEGAGAAPSGIDMAIMMWQYTSNARVPGVSANTVDLNVFYGDVDAFNRYGVAGAVSVPAQPVPPTAPQSAGEGIYVVQKNDVLSTIGPKVNVPWQTIAATNGIVAPYTIFPGQRLKIYGGTPGQAAAVEAVQGGQYMVVKNDNLSGIGVKTGHNWQEIARLNGISDPYTIFPGQMLKLPGGAVATPNESTYTVVSGDGLIRIGQKTGKDWQAIARLNGIGAPYTIYAGQVLRLP